VSFELSLPTHPSATSSAPYLASFVSPPSRGGCAPFGGTNVVLSIGSNASLFSHLPDPKSNNAYELVFILKYVFRNNTHEHFKYFEQYIDIMQYIVNATFLINTIKTNIGIIESIELNTIQNVIEEVETELGIGIKNEMNIKISTVRDKKYKIKIPKSKQRMLSFTDLKLLGIAYERKKSCILVTDDKQLRTIAKHFQIHSYTTPLFIAFMIKNNLISKDKGISFLSTLKEYYIRPKDVVIILNRIKKWR